MIYEKYSKKYLDDLTYEIIGAAIEVHKVVLKHHRLRSYEINLTLNYFSQNILKI
jgi:hypothetical protein